MREERRPAGRLYRRPAGRLSASAIAILIAIVAAFFFPLWGQGYWLPHGGGDAVSFLYPMYRFIAGSLRSGQIPLWNPQQYSGYPLIADNQSGIFYPVNLLLFLLHPKFGYQWLQGLVALHLFWAGLGTWLVARDERGIGRMAALIAATSFMLSDVFVTHLGNLNLIAVAAWLPWAFWAFRRLLRSAERSQQLRWLLLTGLIIGVSTLAGHGQMTFYIAFLLGLYALWQAVAQRQLRPILLLAAVGAISVALSALTLLPMLEMNELSRRGAFSYEETVNYSLPPEALVGLVAPTVHGRGAADFTGTWDRVEVGYMGAVALMLAVVGVGAARFQKQEPPSNLPQRGRKKSTSLWEGLGEGSYFYLAVGFFCLLLALGQYTPVHRLALGWAQLPFQVPARFVLISNFCWALLAAQGAQWVAGWLGRRTAIAPAAVAGVLLTVVAAELLANGMYVEVEPNYPLAGFENTAAIEFLQGSSDINRIDEATALWQPSQAQIHGLYSAGGVFNPLELASHAVYMGSVGYRGSPTYSLMGIKYIVASKDNPPGDGAFIVPVFADDPTVNVYLNTNALPRLMVLHNAIRVPDQDAAFGQLFSEIDFRQTVVVENGRELSADGGQHQIGLIEYSLNRVVVDVSLDTAGYLFLSDMWYPNWQALVDGESAEIVRANYAFRAVYLAPGEHRVEMQFAPRSWRIGATVSGIAWVGVLVWFVALRRGGKILDTDTAEH